MKTGAPAFASQKTSKTVDYRIPACNSRMMNDALRLLRDCRKIQYRLRVGLIFSDDVVE